MRELSEITAEAVGLVARGFTVHRAVLATLTANSRKRSVKNINQLTEKVMNALDADEYFAEQSRQEEMEAAKTRCRGAPR
ncbi:MAG: hypothetical protein R3B69_04075 [Candidatus Paceibacterota bacterium]